MTIKQIKEVAYLLWLGVQVVVGRIWSKVKAYWVMLLAILGFGCAELQYTTMQMNGHQVISVQCPHLWQCERFAVDGCSSGQYITLASTSTSLTFECAVSEDNDNTRPHSGANRP